MALSSASLPFELEVRGTPRDGALVAVLLHGRGADRHDLKGLLPLLPEGTVLVTPEAPHPGGPWNYGPGWAWYRYVREDRVVPDTLATSLERLRAFLGELPEKLPVTPGHVLLGGFSQGGTTSLAYALTHPGAVDAVAVFSGFLVDSSEVVPVRGDALAETPVFWGHGLLDPAIPFALGQRGRERLRGVGVEPAVGDYQMGHAISEKELADLVDWLREHGMVTSP
jgi:phospholipase/carboxylesterase